MIMQKYWKRKINQNLDTEILDGKEMWRAVFYVIWVHDTFVTPAALKDKYKDNRHVKIKLGANGKVAILLLPSIFNTKIWVPWGDIL